MFILHFAAGLAVGVFCPSLARKLKAQFSKESKKAIIFADSAAKQAEVAVAKKL